MTAKTMTGHELQQWLKNKSEKNKSETNRIMRSLGFADDECSEYVSLLRVRVRIMLAKGRWIAAVPRNIENLNNEARASLILELLDNKK